MSGFDTLVFIVVGLAAIAGFFRGFVEEVLALVAWCMALLAVHYFHAPLTMLLESHVGGVTIAGILAFGLLLLVRYLVTMLVVRRIGAAARASTLGPVDRVLGFGFGAVKGFVLSVLAFALLVFACDVVWGAKGRPQWITHARTYPFLNAASDELMVLIAERRAVAGKAPDSDAATADAPSGDAPAPHRARRRHHASDPDA